MFTMTDDLGESCEFLADECMVREEDNYGRHTRRPCTCGYRDAYEDFCYYARSKREHFPHDAFFGCKGCDPVDHESKPYGWKIERFEQEEMLQRARQMVHWWSPAVGPLTWERAKSLAFKWSGFDYELERQSRLTWDALCEVCESHREAVRRYGEWCQRRGLTKKGK